MPDLGQNIDAKFAAAVNAERERRLAAGVTVDVTGISGILVQAAPVNRLDLEDLDTLAAASAPTDVLTFRDANNVNRDLSPAQAAELVAATRAAVAAHNVAAWALKDAAPVADPTDDTHWP